MNPSQDPIPHVLHQLMHITTQMQQTGEHLPPYVELFGDEHIGYVRNGSKAIAETLQNMMQSCITVANGGPGAANPLECKDARHDMRNQVAVVKGFSDLMLMDVDNTHPSAPVLDHLRKLSDQFVRLLDQIKATVESDPQTAAVG